jgi:hypothetical protein
LQEELKDPVLIRIPQGWFVSDKGHLEQHPNSRYNDTSFSLHLKHNLGEKQVTHN